MPPSGATADGVVLELLNAHERGQPSEAQQRLGQSLEGESIELQRRLSVNETPKVHSPGIGEKAFESADLSQVVTPLSRPDDVAVVQGSDAVTGATTTFQQPVLHESNLGVSSNPLCASDSDRAPIPNTIDNNQSSSNILWSSLRRLTDLRMKVLQYRTSTEEESRLIRILNSQLFSELYRLYKGPPATSVTESVAKDDFPEDSADWEECLVQIEDLVEHTIEAGEKFQPKQETITYPEERLQTEEEEEEGEEEEEDMYRSHAPQQLAPSLDLGNGKGDEPVTEGEQDLPEEIERFLALAKTPAVGQTIPAVHFYEHDVGTARESRHPEYPIPEDLDFEDYDTLEDEDFDGDFVDLFGSTDEKFLQFMDSNVSEMIEKAREAALVLETSYSQNDLDRFFRWLAYGRPFSDRLVSARQGPSPQKSVISLFRTWIWHSLQLLSAGLPIPADVPGTANFKEIDFASLGALLTQGWLADAGADVDLHLKAAHTEVDSEISVEENNVQQISSATQPQADSTAPLPHTRHDNIAQSKINTEIADATASTQDILKSINVSEEPGSNLQYDEFPIIYPRRQVQNRRASS